MPITVTTHHEVFLVEHDTIAGMLRETADLVEELESQRDEESIVEIELEVGLIGCRLRHGIRVFYRAEVEDTAEAATDATLAGATTTTRAHPALVLSPGERDLETS